MTSNINIYVFCSPRSHVPSGFLCLIFLAFTVVVDAMGNALRIAWRKSMTATFQTFTFLKSQKSRDEVRKLIIFFRLRDKDGGVRHKLKIQKFLLKNLQCWRKNKGKERRSKCISGFVSCLSCFFVKKKMKHHICE